MKVNLKILLTMLRILWTSVIVISVVVFGIKLFKNEIVVKSDLMSMLPENKQLSQRQQKAIKNLKVESLTLLITYGADEKNQLGTHRIVEKLKKIKGIKSVTYQVNEDQIANVKTFYDTFVEGMISKKDESLLKQNKAEQVKNEALYYAFSPIPGPYSLKEDLFYLKTKFLMSLPFPNESVGSHQGILSVESETTWYALIQMECKEKLGMDEMQKMVREVEVLLKKEELENKGCKSYLTGVPRHSAHASQTAKNEIQWFSTVSLVGSILIVIACLRSTWPLILSVVTVTVSMCLAFVGTLLFFGEIHLLTLVLGSSLIGVSIDYTFHYMVHLFPKDKEKFKKEKKNLTILKEILPALTLGMLTSVIGYMVLLITPFNVLNQMALFSVLGLGSSFLIVICYYPYLPGLGRSRNQIMLSKAVVSVWLKHPKRMKVITCVLMGVGMYGLLHLKAEDDIRLLYNPEKPLIEAEKETRKLLKDPIAATFILVEAKTVESLLQKEESVSQTLDQWVEEKKLEKYYAISAYLPSKKAQTERQRLIEEKLIAPYQEEMEKTVSLKEESKAMIKEKYSIEKALAELQAVNPLVQKMYLKEGDSHFSIIFLKNPSKSIHFEKQDIKIVDTVTNLTTLFHEYRVHLLVLLGIAHILVWAVLVVKYSFKRSFILLIPTVLAEVLSIGSIALMGESLNLFHTIALFILLGIGIDYSLFYQEGSEWLKETSDAIFLSATTTLLSFGILGFSHTPAIKAFGLTILIGMATVYLFSPICIIRKHNDNT